MNNIDAPTDPTATSTPAGDDEAFVREIDRQFGRVYSRGGLAILAAIALFCGLAVALFGVETLKMARLWIGLVLVFLVSLFVLRIFVARRALELLAKTQAYCGTHNLDIGALRAEHTKNETYQFFESVFEVAERRDIAINPENNGPENNRPENNRPEFEADRSAEPPIEPSDANETRS